MSGCVKAPGAVKCTRSVLHRGFTNEKEENKAHLEEDPAVCYESQTFVVHWFGVDYYKRMVICYVCRRHIFRDKLDDCGRRNVSCVSLAADFTGKDSDSNHCDFFVEEAVSK